MKVVLALRFIALFCVFVVIVHLEITKGNMNMFMAAQEGFFNLFVAFTYLDMGLPLCFVMRDLGYTASAHGSFWFPSYSAEFKENMQRYLRPILPGDDHIMAVCKTSMYTVLTSGGGQNLGDPGMHNMNTADPVTTEERVNMYLDACRALYEALPQDSEQRKVLDALTPGRAINVTTPYNPHLSADGSRDGRAQRDKYASERDREALSKRWKPEEDIGAFARQYVKHGLRPVQEEVIPASGVAKAIEDGRVARFDAVELLGPGVWNLSMIDIAELHKDAADSIPLYRQSGAVVPFGSGWEMLTDYVKRTRIHTERGDITWPEYKPWWNASEATQAELEQLQRRSSQSMLVRLLAAVIDTLGPKMMRQTEMYDAFKGLLLQCAVNTRRLTKLPVKKLEDALGNPPWLERAWSMLWLGPVADCWHYDDPDNLLIAVKGDIYVSVFESQDSESIKANGDRGCWAGENNLPPKFTDPAALESHTWVKSVPFITMKLEPGQGIVVPSGVYHSLSLPDGDRVLMNCFMVPKYKGLWDVPAADNSFYNSKWQSEEYAALRALKSSTIFRVWDQHKIGGWFEGTKLEIL